MSSYPLAYPSDYAEVSFQACNLMKTAATQFKDVGTEYYSNSMHFKNIQQFANLDCSKETGMNFGTSAPTEEKQKFLQNLIDGQYTKNLIFASNPSCSISSAMNTMVCGAVRVTSDPQNCLTPDLVQSMVCKDSTDPKCQDYNYSCYTLQNIDKVLPKCKAT
jgi:hypothetical protein